MPATSSASGIVARNRKGGQEFGLCHAELAGGAPGQNPRRRPATDPGHQAQGHGSTLAEAAGDICDALQFERGFDIDRLDPAFDRFAQFIAGLGDAIKHDLLRCKSGRERLPQLAPRINLNAKALGADHAKDV
jgi:hypothetical protein